MTYNVSNWLPPWLGFRSTPSHGYYTISEAKLKEMREVAPALLGESRFFSAGSATFEEDLEWTRFVVAFPDEFDEETVEMAIKAFRDSYPDMYAEHTGKPVDPKDSRELRRRIFYEENAEQWIAVAAFGSWHKAVPDGFTGVWCMKGKDAAERLGGRNVGEQATFLVSSADYKQRGEFGYVIPIGAKEWDPRE